MEKTIYRSSYRKSADSEWITIENENLEQLENELVRLAIDDGYQVSDRIEIITLNKPFPSSAS